MSPDRLSEMPEQSTATGQKHSHEGKWKTNLEIFFFFFNPEQQRDSYRFEAYLCAFVSQVLV